MTKYFGQVNFVIEAESEEEAEQVQQGARVHLVQHYGAIVAAHADELVEADEFGHAG